MTGIQRPWLWSLPTRVELAEGAVIEFQEHGQPGIEFSQSQIDKMFEVGLMQPPRTSDDGPDSGAGVTLDGDARFLVGEVDLGPKVGLEVLVRGLEVAVDASYREYRERHPQAEADDDDGGETGPGDDAIVPDLLGSAREVIIAVDEAGARLDDLLDEVQQGAQIVFVRDGKRVAVMTSWRAYVGLREKSAGMAAAYWAAWRTGTFDATGYATDVTRILHRRPGTTPTPPSDDDRRTTEGGDGR